MSDPLTEAMMTTETNRLREKLKVKKPRDMGDEIDDEPNPVDDPFPRTGTKAEQEQWRRREENRKRPGVTIRDPLVEAMKGQ
jgi:hypothetical protein